MTEHRLLTGASLHEPKGVETASNGQVYESNGTGSGTWVGRNSGILNLNTFSLSGVVPDVSAPGSSFFAVVPQKANLTKIYTILSGAVITANSTVTIYKNGIAQTPTVTVAFTGSGAGVTTTTTPSPAITFLEGDTLEVRSNGASDNTASLSVGLKFTAIV